MAASKTIAIVGAGFSGVMTAVHLLRSQSPCRILTFNRSGPSARGVAYGTNSPSHLLNVPCGRMSAYPDEPGHFAAFVARRVPTAGPAAFVPRSLYGEYLETQLAEAAAHGPNYLERVVADVASIRPTAGGVLLIAADGREFPADRVVLAVGNYPPAHPAGLPAEFLNSDRYVRDPWARGSLTAVPTDLPALLVGTGLTMLDVALDLKARSVGSAIAVSRRGLLPRPHEPSVPPADPSHRPHGLDAITALPKLVAAVRARIAEVEAAGGNWRQVIDSLRPVTPALWQRLPLVEKQRFLRHVRPYWDVHRHRVAPATAVAVSKLTESGWLTVRKGRFLNAVAEADAAVVTLQPRGGGPAETLRVGAMVNCTGPATDVASAADPLLADLFARGLAKAEPFGIGLDVAKDGGLIAADGTVSDRLFYIGPFLRGRDGEGTAVPELRGYAAAVAGRIIQLATPAG